MNIIFTAMIMNTTMSSRNEINTYMTDIVVFTPAFPGYLYKESGTHNFFYVQYISEASV